VLGNELVNEIDNGLQIILRTL